MLKASQPQQFFRRRHRSRTLLKSSPFAVAALLLAGCGSSGSGAAAPTAAPAENHLHSIAILPSNPNAAYFGGHYYLYRTNDGGKQWSRLTKQMMLSLALNPRQPTTLFGVSLQNGLVVSHNGGVKWTSLTSAVPKGNVTAVIVDSAVPAIVAYG